MTDNKFKDQYEKFKETWTPDDELAAEADRDEKRSAAVYSNTLKALSDVTDGLLAITTTIQTRTNKLHEVQKEIHDAEVRLTSMVGKLIESNDATVKWWDEQMKLMSQQMIMMAAMGFELDLEPPKS